VKVVLARAAQSDEEDSDRDEESDWGEQLPDEDRDELNEEAAKSANWPLFAYTGCRLLLLKL